MATRDRTVLYIQYRNSFAKLSNATTSQAKRRNNGDGDEDEQNLLGTGGGMVAIDMNSLQPQWMDMVQEVEADLLEIQKQLQQLETVQKKSILTTFDDSQDDQVDRLTAAITMDFSRAQAKIKQVGVQSQQLRDGTQELMGKNAMAGLASKLQDASTRFRTAQNQYLAKIRGRDSKANDFLVASGLDRALDSAADRQHFDMGFT